MTHSLPALTALLLALILSACAGFGDFQSARLAGPGNTQLTPSATATWLQGEEDAVWATHHLGLRLTRGLTPAMDLIGGVEYIGSRGERSRWVLGAGPKLALVQDRLALWLPVGAVFGQNVRTGETWQANPTLLFTFDAAPELEVTPSVKALIPLHPELRRELQYLLVLNLGMGWSPAGAAWTLRPEAGLFLHPNGLPDGRVWHFGVGATIPLAW